MTYLRELFGQVISSLLRNKLRSFLTMAGIAWGVASMVLIVAMGDGFKVASATVSATRRERRHRVWRAHREAGRGRPRGEAASGSTTTTCATFARNAFWCATWWPNCRTGPEL